MALDTRRLTRSPPPFHAATPGNPPSTTPNHYKTTHTTHADTHRYHHEM